MKTLRFMKIMLACISLNVMLFEFGGDSSPVIEKQLQFAQFAAISSFPILRALAEYIHKRAALLDPAPYLSPESDSRLASWFLPPEQVVGEWLVFITIFVGTLCFGAPGLVWSRKFHLSSAGRYFVAVLFLLSLASLLAIVYYKFRAFLELGEWFALLYLLQPCHVLMTGYVFLGYGVLKSSHVTIGKWMTLFHVLFDLQWFTWVAIALPDLEALLQRDFLGEYFLFYFEHILLIVLPYLYLGVFEGAKSTDRRHRALHSLAWFGLHHIQVMTPVSLVSGVQINYQTHLPPYALPWFGRWYKTVITLASFGMIIAFACIVDPIAKRAIERRGREKFV